LPIAATAEEQPAKQDRDWGNQQGDEQRIRRSGVVDEPEVKHVAERSAQESERSDCRHCAQRREGVSPRLVDQHRQWQHHQRAGGQLSGRHAERRNPEPPEATCPDGGKRVAERGCDAGQFGEAARPEAREQGWADHHGHSAEAEHDPGDLSRVHPLVIREKVGDDDSPDRRGCIEDRRETACDVGLAPAEESEWQRIVEKREEQDRAPDLLRQRDAFASGDKVGP
jgi:hypothetical protein